MMNEVDGYGRHDGVRTLLSDFCAGHGSRAACFQHIDANSAPIAISGDKLMPAASLVKLWVVETLMLQLGPDELDHQVVPVADLDRTMYPTVLAAKASSDRLSWREICALTLITSDNPTATAVLEQVGFDAVNSRIESLGLSGTVVDRSFHDEDLGIAGRANVTTACDMVSTLLHIWASRDVFPYNLMSMWLVNNLRNERLSARLPDEVPVAHKTGSLEGVVNDVGVVVAKRPYVLAVLMDGQSDRARSAIEISELSERVYGLVART